MKIMTVQLKTYLFLLLLIIVMTMSACGQTGDLYLPENASEDAQEESKQKPKEKSY